MKRQRQNEILAIISEFEIENQEMLCEKLRERGDNGTQSTGSRDINELSLEKTLSENGVSCYMRGDVDFSSKTNVYDAAFIQKAIAGAYGYPEYKDMDVNSPQLMAADVDLSGSVNIVDASIILRHNTGDSTTAKYGIGTVITL